MTTELIVHLPRPHPRQAEFIDSPAQRKICRAGRRGGKTIGVSIMAVQSFLAGKRVLYGAPTIDQVDRFWTTVVSALAAPIAAKVFYKNETEHSIELRGTEQRIRAKTCWDADHLRGDYADLLILDEWQMMDPTTWSLVGAPMMLDKNGSAVFVYTPPSLHSRSVTKAQDPQHAAKMFKRALADTSGRWAAFTFSSHDNPHLSTEALDEITQDMTQLAYRQEVLAEDIDAVPGALWTRDTLERSRQTYLPELVRVVVAIDPAMTSGEESDETGIIVGGLGTDGHGYLLADVSLRGTPFEWATAAIGAYRQHKADRVIGEVNNGGEMVGYTLGTVDPTVSYRAVHASRGKATRAEPVAALFEQGRVHLMGSFPDLEEQLCTWTPGDAQSPDRLDAMTWAISELMLRENTISVEEYGGDHE